MIDNYCAPPGNACNATQQMAAIQPHDAGSMMNLFEGNQGQSFAFDFLHGTTPMNTLFRNQMGMYDPGKTRPSLPALRRRLRTLSEHHWQRLGQGRGGQSPTNRETRLGRTAGRRSTTSAMRAYEGPCNQFGTVTITTNTGVSSTMFRWGNYDIVNDAVRFVSGEVPTGDTYYPNAIPASQTCPPRSIDVGPTGILGDALGDARLACGRTGRDGRQCDGRDLKPGGTCVQESCAPVLRKYHVTGGIKNFDAAVCYGVAQAPPPVTRFYLRFAEIILLFGGLIWKCRVPLLAGCVALASLTPTTYQAVQLNAPIVTAKTVYYTKAVAAKAILSVLPKRR